MELSELISAAASISGHLARRAFETGDTSPESGVYRGEVVRTLVAIVQEPGLGLAGEALALLAPSRLQSRSLDFGRS